MGVSKVFVFWKGDLGTDIWVFLRYLCFGGRFRNRNIDVPKAFVLWKGGLGTEILMFLRRLCFGRAV